MVVTEIMKISEDCYERERERTCELPLLSLCISQVHFLNKQRLCYLACENSKFVSC